MIDKLAIIGVGLIGGSLARALRATGWVREIVGYGRSIGNIAEAVRLGVIDYAATNPMEAVRDADVVVIAVPVGSIGPVLERIVPALTDRTVITDVGSVKAPIVAAARAALGTRFPAFVPGHPIAGTERSGAAAADPDLFRGARVVLTPEPDTAAAALERVRALWLAAGATVVTLAATTHDRVLAVGSHLPHVLAYTLMDMIVRLDEHRAIVECAGGSLRDGTRVAASDPALWRDIFLTNRADLAALVRAYQNDLGAFADAIEHGDEDWLMETLARAQRARQGF